MPLQHRQIRANGMAYARNMGAQGRYLQPLRDLDGPGIQEGQQLEDGEDMDNGVEADERPMACCLPSGCPRLKDLISSADPGEAVKVICNNDGCMIAMWMHADCFQEWEQQVLGFLRSCGRARSWSEKQRFQNVWTKKGYDLAFKACDCKCGKGHLRKDLDYVPSVKKSDERRLKKQRKNKTITSPSGKTFTAVPWQQHHVDNVSHTPLRIRTSSLCSTGSSPPSSDGTPPMTPGSAPLRSSSGARFDFFVDEEQAAAGNIFWRRTDLSAFTLLPRQNQNPYQIKIEDEGPHGNDETRSFILTQLSVHKITSTNCAVCQIELVIYDKYPLIDGTFFLSPHQYNRGNIAVTHERRPSPAYLNAVCMRCLGGAGTVLHCLNCKTPWSGTTLIIGTMYTYDIFAAVPCCEARLACKSCRQAIVRPGGLFPFFSDYSRSIRCPLCGTEDHHFVRPLEATFYCGSGRQLLGQLF